MSEIINKIAFYISIGIFTIVNFVVTLAFAISPAGSSTPQLMDRYKLSRLIIGSAPYFFCVGKRWMVPALLVPVAQTASFFWFLSYIESLSLG